MNSHTLLKLAALLITLIALVVFPLALVIIGLIAVRLHRERGISQERLADITSILQETISGVKVVKAFAMEEFENKKFVKQTQRYFRSLIKITRMRDLSSPSTELPPRELISRLFDAKPEPQTKPIV